MGENTLPKPHLKMYLKQTFHKCLLFPHAVEHDVISGLLALLFVMTGIWPPHRSVIVVHPHHLNKEK
jgi:hypothetical protein